MHDDREEGSEEKGQSEDEGDLLTEPITGKRRHVRSWRMQEYLQQQDKTLPQKQRKCPYPGCEKQFSSAPGLRYHLRTHSPNARHFCCDRCKKEFKSHNGLKYHLQRTKCPDTPVDVPPPPPPPSPPHQHHQQHSPPPSLPCLPSPAECEGSANRRSSSEKDETDSMYDTALGLPVQDWPEPRHRKMESRRKQMLLAAQAKTVEAEPQLASAQPTRRPQPLEPVGSSGADKRLLDFATIATGPQSPLMTTKRIDWEPASRVVGCDSTMKDAIASDICVNVSPLSTSASTPVTSTVTHTTATSLQAESDTKALESSSPLHSSPKESDCVGSWSSTWPTAVWQCFIKGTKVHLGGEDAAPPWHLVETVAVSHLQEHSFTLPEDLRQPVPLRLVSQQKSVEQDDQVELRFESQSSHQSCLTACCMLHHPFFVRDKGWASCNSEKTKAVYGLHSSHLEIGDICLPPCYSQQIPASKDSEGSEVNSLEYSSVVALSSMAQKRGQEGSLGQQMSPVSPSRQQAPKAKRPMNAFLLWSQTKRPEFITKFPRTNNRDISSMLSKEWRKLSDSEKKQLQNEAKVKAEYQKQQHPDCWKRKHARRDHR